MLQEHTYENDACWRNVSLRIITSSENKMNIKSIVIIILRLYALNFFLEALIKIIPTAMRILMAFEGLEGVQKAIPWSLIVILLVFSIIFWFLAFPIANLVTRKLPNDELTLGSLTLINCYTVAFFSIGLFFVVSNVANSFSWFYYIFHMAVSTSGPSWKSEVDWYSASATITPFIVGIVLVFKAKFWADKLLKYHNK
jgi:hypothetical protein